VSGSDLRTLATTEALMRLLSLKASLDRYHQSRADAHGYIYIHTRTVGAVGDVVEAKSIATGGTVTLMAPYFDVKEVEDAQKST
jgi:hypothetical protein